MNYIRNSKVAKSLASVFIILFVLIVFFIPNWGRVIYGAEPYVSTYNSLWVGFCLRVAYMLSALLLSACFLCIWSSITAFSQYGKYTLHLLIFHSWFILLFKLTIGMNLYLGIVASVLILITTVVISQCKYSSILLNPITILKNIDFQVG